MEPKVIHIKNLNGMIFATTEDQFKNYQPYGSTIATDEEWDNYKNNVVATIEAKPETPALGEDKHKK